MDKYKDYSIDELMKVASDWDNKPFKTEDLVRYLTVTTSIVLDMIARGKTSRSELMQQLRNEIWAIQKSIKERGEEQQRGDAFTMMMYAHRLAGLIATEKSSKSR